MTLISSATVRGRRQLFPPWRTADQIIDEAPSSSHAEANWSLDIQIRIEVPLCAFLATSARRSSKSGRLIAGDHNSNQGSAGRWAESCQDLLAAKSLRS